MAVISMFYSLALVGSGVLSSGGSHAVPSPGSSDCGVPASGGSSMPIYSDMAE